MKKHVKCIWISILMYDRISFLRHTTWNDPLAWFVRGDINKHSRLTHFTWTLPIWKLWAIILNKNNNIHRCRHGLVWWFQRQRCLDSKSRIKHTHKRNQNKNRNKFDQCCFVCADSLNIVVIKIVFLNIHFKIVWQQSLLILPTSYFGCIPRIQDTKL